MKISDIQITPIKPRNGLVAFVSCVVDDSFYLGSIGLHQKRSGEGYRITFPTRKIANTNISVYNPTSVEVTQQLLNEISKKAKNMNWNTLLIF